MSKMVKRRFNVDEWYPVYSLEKQYRAYNKHYNIKVPQELVDRYDRIMAEFDAMQAELRAIDEGLKR